VQRTVLFRGVVKHQVAETRKEKLAGFDDLKDVIVNIDGYNVLITVASYLEGTLIYVSNDGLLRDASESHGKILKSEYLSRSLELTVDFLKISHVSEARFFLDKPVSNSAQLSGKIRTILSEKKVAGSSETVRSPDYVLKEVTEGICSSSDSSIIDGGKTKIFDLAKNVIIRNFDPKIYDLENYLKK
jgi:hypothetical protein